MSSGSRLEREWDAASYETLAAPMTRWGTAFLGRLELRGGEYVLDAGCGTGRVTERLLERLPEGRVLAVDASEGMVAAAKERFAGESRVRVERCDLLELDSLAALGPVGDRVDLIFSTATFHWIPDHDRLFGSLYRALGAGGRLAAQCGGAGNISRVGWAAEEVMGEEPFAGYFEGWRDGKLYADPQSTRRRLERAGFHRPQAWLQEEPTPFESIENLARYLEKIILRSHHARLPEELRRPFARSVAGKISEYDGPLLIDYVRLNLLAEKPA